MEYVKKLESVIKLVGISKLEGDKLMARVCPCILKYTHPLSMVSGVFNAIFVNGNMSGDTMYYGSGAGKLPTASAVVSDIIDAARHIGVNVRIDWDKDVLPVEDENDAVIKAFIRFKIKDENTMAECQKVFENSDIICLDDHKDEFALITESEKEGEIKEKLGKTNAEVLSFIRMEG